MVCGCRLRGTGGDLVILEEAAFIATEVWTEVVIPLLEVKNTGLIAISTPLDSVCRDWPRGWVTSMLPS